MTIRDVLMADREELPNWLRSAPQLDREVARNFLASRVVFYPGAGADLHTIKVFGRAQSAHCFVHADYGAQTEPQDFDGYKVAVRQQLDYASLVKLFGMNAEHPFPGCWEGFATAEAIERGQSWWVVYRIAGAADDRDQPCFAVLHAYAEAVWLYWNFWALRQSAPYAVLLQDHGFGGNWTTFGGPTDAANEAALYQLALQTNAFPRWLLVGNGTAVWPGYERATADEVEGTRFGATSDHARKLFGRGSASTKGQV
jgi:hypothetical protein